MSSLPGVSVCSDTGTRARTQIHIVVMPLRRFIYLLDSCPEPLTRFSTGAESTTKHVASFSPAYERDCHAPSRPAGCPPCTCGVLGCTPLAARRFLCSPVWGVFLGLLVSFPLLLCAFPTEHLPSFYPCTCFCIPFLFSSFLSLFPFPVPLPLPPSLSLSLLRLSTRAGLCSAALSSI